MPEIEISWKFETPNNQRVVPIDRKWYTKNVTENVDWASLEPELFAQGDELGALTIIAQAKDKEGAGTWRRYSKGDGTWKLLDSHDTTPDEWGPVIFLGIILFVTFCCFMMMVLTKR